MATIESAELAHHIDLERAAMGIARGIKPSLDNIADYVRLILTKYNEQHGDKIRTVKDRDELIKKIVTFMQDELSGWSDELTEQLNEVISNELGFQNAVIRNATSASLVVPTLEQAAAIVVQTPLVLNGKAITWNDYIKSYTPNQISEVKNQIIAGFVNGETTTQISRNIVGTRSVTGSLKKSYSSAQMMVKDLCSHQSSMVKAEFGLKNQDVIIGEKVIVTLDSKTSPICVRYGSLDGGGKEFYYKKDGRNFPRPGFHRRCRSTTRYILSKEYQTSQAGETRPAVVNGKAIQVPVNMSYLEFAKKYPSVAVSALGKTKAKLIDDMSAKDFLKYAYNRLGEPMTLEDMAKSSKKIAKDLKQQ